ncbi:hypothetical protein ARMSODRAFT_988697 [Armillaria solidipes]|uniref:CxC1-like cysteine cluster associated with KDZ transposases domain-containing protein n=1 Tax=Armillaria solidipes TaxID=1076256 RepID=A0A2H3BHP8_9AGAR|nr:hypothetical protein ARMSODRAFT_988697 [Armillaria solidipes]
MTQGDPTTDGPDYSGADAADTEMMNDVLAGRAPLEISHGGGEYIEVMAKLRSLMKEKQRLLLCAPFHPSVIVTIPTMEVYHAAHLWCPQFNLQPFVKMLCDLHSQFSICYDLYVDLLNTVHGRVLNALGHDIPDWRALNACPCCTYKLEESEVIDNDGGTVPGESIKRLDLQNGRAQVDKWSKEAIGESLVHSRDGNDESPCSDRWQNMVNDMSARAWGIFNEMGIFVCLCRHGFVLLAADMVRSGELAKYPLAIVEQLLDLFGDNLGIGYDVSCKFSITVSQSPLGEHACEHRFCALVGLFHGHAHQRHTYVLSMGLEDLEGCERFFLGSNALVLGVRHASRFYRHQAIMNYMKCKDRFDTFQNLSAFLCNNYHQALDILQECPILDDSMQRLEVGSESVIEGWLKEEEEYLATLLKEPPQETLEMEYFIALLDYHTFQASVDDTASVWMTVTAETVNRQTHKTEMACRHLVEKRDNALKTVQMLEACLEMQCWEIGCEKWLANKKRVKMQTYQHAIDNLECLVVSRIFKLTKMNMSHTGYKMRKHIGKALQSRSQAIRTVVEYAFLSDFDLLRDPGTREGIQEMLNKVWATPVGRATMDRYFKIKRAEEEIDHLNIEIPCLLSYMADEDDYLEEQCCSLEESLPALSHQISHYRLE